MATTVAQAKAAIYSQLASAPIFHPSTADLFTDFTVESGDIYTVSSDSTSYSVPVYGMKLKWNGSSKVEVQNSGNVQRDPVEKMAQKKSRRGGRSYMNGNIVEDQIAGVRSTVTQLSNSWSVVVEGTGQNAHIKPAVIQASINAATGSSKITLSADNIILDGDAVASSLLAHDLTVGDLTANGITADSNVVIIDEEGLFVGEQTMLVADVYKDPNDANTIIVIKTDGTSFRFSKGGSSGTVSMGWGTAPTSNPSSNQNSVNAQITGEPSTQESRTLILDASEAWDNGSKNVYLYTGSTSTDRLAKIPVASGAVASKIKAGETICGITGTYSANASIDSVSEIHGAISGDTTARSSMTVRASGTNVSSRDQGYTLQKAIHSDQNFVEVLEGTNNPITVGRISTESVWNAGMTFQLGKMVPFIGYQSNEAYNNRITTITSNGTYYACAEGYKSHTE